MKMDFTEIYCHVDDFLKELDHRTGLIVQITVIKPGVRAGLIEARL